MGEKIVIGTRGSELAQKQARMVEDALRGKWSDLEIETKIIKTSGDDPVVDLHAGRKGLFTSTIEQALLGQEIDLGVHSAKDLPSELTSGTEISAALARASVGDVLVSLGQINLDSLPKEGAVATGSVRRQHQLRWKRPDLKIVDLRGNVPTRLRKLVAEHWDGIVLARAGLQRLGLEGAPFHLDGNEFHMVDLPTETFLPAGGQGVIAAQIRSEDDRLRMLSEAINDFDTRLCLRAERQFLRLLQSDCNQPVGVLAAMEGAIMKIHGQIFDEGAATPREATVQGPIEDAEKIAAELFERIGR